ncbi:hypothetical protein VP01_1639g15 [Puccinia sorghi]|uniref:Uncharacterized protein n=1 Tax=Puccinia sorghi TaxID=27349 RepID=A0A0L6VGS2_9BASI|nr:hypothetical protein VP01_1639g15 [Puccinia sorghi]
MVSQICHSVEFQHQLNFSRLIGCPFSEHTLFTKQLRSGTLRLTIPTKTILLLKTLELMLKTAVSPQLSTPNEKSDSSRSETSQNPYSEYSQPWSKLIKISTPSEFLSAFSIFSEIYPRDFISHMEKTWIPPGALAQLLEFYLNEGFLDESEVAQRIYVEELGPCDIDHWMSMPTTGHLMAEFYNRLVFYYGKSWSQKLFPLTNLPKNNPPIFIGLTESQHFVVLKMKDENVFLVAQLEKNWKQIATPEAMQ